jgi:hypothetical protein
MGHYKNDPAMPQTDGRHKWPSKTRWALGFPQESKGAWERLMILKADPKGPQHDQDTSYGADMERQRPQRPQETSVPKLAVPRV